LPAELPGTNAGRGNRLEGDFARGDREFALPAELPGTDAGRGDRARDFGNAHHVVEGHNPLNVGHSGAVAMDGPNSKNVGRNDVVVLEGLKPDDVVLLEYDHNRVRGPHDAGVVIKDETGHGLHDKHHDKLHDKHYDETVGLHDKHHDKHLNKHHDETVGHNDKHHDKLHDKHHDKLHDKHHDKHHDEGLYDKNRVTEIKKTNITEEIFSDGTRVVTKEEEKNFPKDRKLGEQQIHGAGARTHEGVGQQPFNAGVGTNNTGVGQQPYNDIGVGHPNAGLRQRPGVEQKQPFNTAGVEQSKVFPA